MNFTGTDDLCDNYSMFYFQRSWMVWKLATKHWKRQMQCSLSRKLNRWPFQISRIALCSNLIVGLLITKDAGFVYESLRNESSNLEIFFSRNESMKRIFQKRIHKTNPRYESLRFVVTNPDSRIRILRIHKDSDSRIFIFKDSFRAIVLRIRKDL
jgi:hypothetical protein